MQKKSLNKKQEIYWMPHEDAALAGLRWRLALVADPHGKISRLRIDLARADAITLFCWAASRAKSSSFEFEFEETSCCARYRFGVIAAAPRGARQIIMKSDGGRWARARV